MSVFSEDLINKIMLYVSHPCADMIKQAVKDEYADENRECAIIGRRVVFTYSGRNVKKQEYNYNEKVIAYYIHNKFKNLAITYQSIRVPFSDEYIFINTEQLRRAEFLHIHDDPDYKFRFNC
jgi:predicted glycosyltransferase